MRSIRIFVVAHLALSLSFLGGCGSGTQTTLTTLPKTCAEVTPSMDYACGKSKEGDCSYSATTKKCEKKAVGPVGIKCDVDEIPLAEACSASRGSENLCNNEKVGQTQVCTFSSVGCWPDFQNASVACRSIKEATACENTQGVCKVVL